MQIINIYIMKKTTQIVLSLMMIGVLVTGQNAFAAGKITNESSGSFTIQNNSPQEVINARAGQDIFIPVRLGQSIEIGAISLVLQYPEADLDIVGVEVASQNGFTEFNTIKGELRISWFSLEKINIEAGNAMVWIRARLKNNIKAGKTMVFIPDPSCSLADASAMQINDLSVILPIVKSTEAAVKHTVMVSNYSFTPADISDVIVGDTIEWVWSSGTHTTTSGTIPVLAAPWNHIISSGNAKYDYKVTKQGVYNYVCTPHAAMGMTGSFTASPGSGVGIPVISQDAVQLEIVPNPVINNCQLNFNAPNSGQGEIVLYDLLGKLVMHHELPIVLGENTYTLSVASLQSGEYLLQIVDASGTLVTKKLIHR